MYSLDTLISYLKSNSQITDDTFIPENNDYIEWKVHGWNKLNCDSTLNSPNFRIGNSIWYIINITDIYLFYLYII